MDEWKYQPARDLGLHESERLKSVQRESGLGGLIARSLWWWWVRWILRLTERIEISGHEHLPDSAPFVMVANHSSHLDVMVLATALPPRLRNRVLPLAAGDTFFETPAVAVFAAEMMNALPMWRKHFGHFQAWHRHDCGWHLSPRGPLLPEWHIPSDAAGREMAAAQKDRT